MASGARRVRASGSRVRRDVADSRRVLRIIQQIKQRTYKVNKGGKGGKYLIQRSLNYSSYKLLLEELEKAENRELLAFVDQRLRFDFIRHPCKGDKQFVIHMPSEFGKAMVGEFNTMIIIWLGKIADGTLCKVESTKIETMRIANGIKSTLAQTVKCSEPRDDQLEPDLSFTCKGCRTADLVVEVAWSQSNLNLSDRATRFIHGTKGAIRTVIGLNMNDIYRSGCRAMFSVWEAEQDGGQWRRTTSIDNEEFIDENGEVVDNCKLRLSLKDFICTKRVGMFRDFEDIQLEIPSTTLYDFYKNALAQQIMDDAGHDTAEMEERIESAYEKVVTIKNIMQEKGTEDAQERKFMGEKDLKDIGAMISNIGDEIGELERMMTSVEEMMDKGDNTIEEMDEVEEYTGLIGDLLAELDTSLANARVQVGKIVEADGRPSGTLQK
ncbi:hypothetical protein F4859DRAFT_514529 [Xylaria cf. heliscus]|nr:hypothetical protein F4859DRAFT_514529 [Xylaria cf. heliscus]